MKPLVRLPVRRTGAELEDEFAFHLEMRTRELIEQGWTPEAARAEARRLFGDLEEARRYCHDRDERRGKHHMRTELIQELRQDAAYAGRTLRRAPAFALVAALTLALGIGANTAIFSVVRGILLRPLPFADPGRLAAVLATYEGDPSPYVSPANAYDWRVRNRSFTGLAVLAGHSAVLTGAGDPELLAGYEVSPEFFSLLGIAPVRGRLVFSPEEAAYQGPRAVIVSETLWRTRFGADSALVGRLITLDNERYEVVGVAPAASAWPANTLVWFPFTFDPVQLPTSRGAVYLTTLARLRPGITFESASDDMRAVAARLEQEHPVNARVGATVVPLHQTITESIDQPLYILLGGVGFVLLIACSNVANLLLVRGIAREGELTVRTALGAGRGRLVRQLMTESVVLALLGGGAGLLLATLGTRLLVQAAPASIPRLDDIHIDGMVLGFTLMIALITGLGFGLVPARLVLRGDIGRGLKEGGRGGSQRSGSVRTRRVLVVTQVALSVMLLAGAGLLIRSFNRLMHVDPGFRTSGTVSFNLSLPESSYSPGEPQATFVRTLVEQISSIPGVHSAAVGLGTPLTGFSFGFSFEIGGRPALDPADQPSAQVRVATPEYFTTMGISVVRGRGFTPADRAGGQRVLLITETAARRFFPGEDPIGRHVRFGWGRDERRFEGDIVGVVRDVKQFSLAHSSQPQFWGVFDQRPVASFDVVIHSSRELQSVVADAKRVIQGLDPGLAVSRVRTLEEIVAASVAAPRFYMLLLTVFAVVAIGLSGIGIYGVIAYLVGQRSREIGIRLALGASQGRVVRMVVREGAMMAAAGIAVGILGALGLTRLLRALLFGVSATDPATYAGVMLILAAVALAACSVPALRASKVDPVRAIRAE